MLGASAWAVREAWPASGVAQRLLFPSILRLYRLPAQSPILVSTHPLINGGCVGRTAEVYVEDKLLSREAVIDIAPRDIEICVGFDP